MFFKRRTHRTVATPIFLFIFIVSLPKIFANSTLEESMDDAPRTSSEAVVAVERRLTTAPHGHLLTNTGVWSHDGRWIRFGHASPLIQDGSRDGFVFRQELDCPRPDELIFVREEGSEKFV